MITLDKESHLYTDESNGQMTNLSVTRVLELSIIPPYPSDAKVFVERAGDLGEAVHEWCAYYDTHLFDEKDYAELGDVAPYLGAYFRFTDKYRPSWICIENPMIRDGIGGMADRIGYLCNGDDVHTLLDIKTSKKISPWWGIQLTGYEWLYRLKDARLQVLHLAKDSSYRLLEYPSEPRVWEAALDVARWKIKNP